MNDQELDDRIRRALHVEPTAEQLARLEQHWRRARARKRRPTLWLAAAAACLAVVGLCGWLLVQLIIQQPQQQIAIDHGHEPPSPRVARSPIIVQEPPSVVHPMQLAVDSPREASDYEQLLFSIQTGRRLEPPPRDKAALAKMVESIDKRDGVRGLAAAARNLSDVGLRAAAYDRLLQNDAKPAFEAYLALVADESTRREALDAIPRDKNPPIDALLNVLTDDERPLRIAAALTLSRINTPEVVEKLIDRVTSPDSSSEAWMALYACRNETADRFLATASQNPRLLGRYNYARLQWTRLTP
jgi:hypothetical protein